jgi:hypothetical protein
MKKQVIIHPFLFALFPALFLFGTNSKFVDFPVVFRPALLSLAVVSIAWMALTAAVRAKRQAAIAVSLTVLGVFSFQAVSQALNSLASQQGIQGLSTGHQIIVGSLALTLAGTVLCLKLRKYLEEITYLMNVVGTVLVAVPLTTVAIEGLVGSEVRELMPPRAAFEAALNESVKAARQPDIYYIILDGYGRADVLLDEYGFDNSGLVDYLREKGFLVASQSRSNYPQTLLSIASSLNFVYLDEVLGNRLGDLRDRRFVRELLRDSRAVGLLRKAGYSTVAFASEFYEAEIASADLRVAEWWFPNTFETGLINMTPVPWLMAKTGSPLLYDLHRARILYSFAQLARMPAVPGPKFVYAHIFVGHPPFVFGPNGEKVTPDRPYNWDEGDAYVSNPGASLEEYRERYEGQVTFLNQRLKATLDSILADSGQPPIVIVQGDHGPGSGLNMTELGKTDVRERYSILNAYYLPNSNAETMFYDSISPVNTFRLVLNSYFGTKFPLLPDKSYYTPFLQPYQFTLVDPDQFAARREQEPIVTGVSAK